MNIDILTQIFIERLESGLNGIRNRKTNLSDSEMMTIYICFHHSHYTNFKAYYNEYVSVRWQDEFPGLCSYERFNSLQKRLLIPMIVFLKEHCMGKCRGINFIDSTTIKVCHIKREKQHRVLNGLATKGKSTMGWFFGFKLHLIINDKGEILSFYLSKANTDDRDMDVMNVLTQNIFGKIFADRGYISQVLADYLWNDGIHLIYKLRKNMKKQNISDIDKVLLRKRALIESVNDELKNICAIEHSRHRSLQGFLNNLVTALCAYHYLPKKPSLNIEPIYDHQQKLIPYAA